MSIVRATSTTTMTAVSPSTTEAVLPPSSTTSSTTTRAPAGAATTTVRRPTTTTAPAPASATAPPASPAASTTAPARTCTPDQVELTAAPDMASYPPSQRVEFTATLRNRSSPPCSYNGYSIEFTFKDAAGEAWGGGNVDAAPLGDVRLEPGQTLVQSAPWRHSLSPPGTYSASVSWTFAGHTYDRTVAFTLT